MTRTTARLLALVAAISSALAITVLADWPQQQPPAVSLTITGEPGALPRYAVPDFIALSSDADTIDAAKTIGQVLWDDLNFEREFDMIPRDTYASIPAARSCGCRARSSRATSPCSRPRCRSCSLAWAGAWSG